MTNNNVYLLITSIGYEIQTVQFDSLLDVQTEMKEQYKTMYDKYSPILTEYDDSCYCEKLDARLFANGDEVYVWKIVEVDCQNYKNN